MGLVLGLDVAFTAVGLALIEVEASPVAIERGVPAMNGWPGSASCEKSDWLSAVGPLARYRERLMLLETIHPEKPGKQHAMYVADKDYLMAQSLYRQLVERVLRYKPNLVAMELPSGGAQNGRAARLMGMATALVATLPMMMAALGHDEIGFVCRTPEEVKHAVTGSRSGSKLEIQRVVQLGYAANPELFAMAKGDLEHCCDAAGAVWAVRDCEQYRAAAVTGG